MLQILALKIKNGSRKFLKYFMSHSNWRFEISGKFYVRSNDWCIFLVNST